MIESLNLRDAELGNATIKALLTNVHTRPVEAADSEEVPGSALTALDISGNAITEEIATDIANAFAALPALQVIHLDDNDELGESEDTISLLCQYGFRRLKRLKQLSLCHCELSSIAACTVVR